VSERSEVEAQRAWAADILRQHRDEFIRRWMQKAQLLTHEKEGLRTPSDLALREEAGKLFGVLLAQLQSGPEGDLAAFYDLILGARGSHFRLADLAYLLLELKSVGKGLIFEHMKDELAAFRTSRLVDDAVEAMLRHSAELYELADEADQKTAQERLQEIFAAWELEKVVADAYTPADLCRLAAAQFRAIWPLVGVRLRVYADGVSRDITDGLELPVPSVRVRRQYLTARESENGGLLDVMEAVRRRRKGVMHTGLRDDSAIGDAEALREAGVQSLACFPLIRGDGVGGALLLYAPDEDTFQPADERRLRDLARVLALSLDRTARLEQSHKEMSEAELIARMGRVLLELPTRGLLLQGVVEALREFRDYLDVSLFRIDEDAGECVLVAEAGREGPYRPDDYRQSIGKGFIGLCAQNGRTIRAVDLQQDERRLIAFDEEYRARSELAVPVRRGDSIAGVIHLLSEREDDFPESEIEAIEHVAPHIGVALLNAQMLAERRHDRYEIEQAHRQLVNIIRSTAVGITSTSPGGAYTHWSPSCEAMLGYREEEMVGLKTPADIAAEPYDLAAALDECYRTGETSVERTLQRKDGTHIVVQETRVPLEDESGEHIGFTAYFVDVTERKQAEERLRRERDTLSLVVGAMGAGLALFDQELKLRWANSTLMAWFDFGPEAYGSDCHEVYRCGRPRDEACPMALAVATGMPQIRIHEVTDATGAWHCYQQVFTPVQHRDTRMVVLTQDITEQRGQTEHMRLINKLAEKVETSLDLERVLHLVLTCVTAGHAIGLNRAFVFLVDDAERYLEGKMAVGPVSQTDARQIWEDLGHREQTIEQLLDSATPSAGDRQLTRVVSSLRIPLANKDDTLIGTLNSRTSAHVGDARVDANLSPERVEKLAREEFVCVPLSVQQQPLGVMLADNKFSRARVSRDHLMLLEMFSR